MPAYNERFHASGGVCPQTVLWEFGSFSPARTFVNPRLREAATTLNAMAVPRPALERHPPKDNLRIPRKRGKKTNESVNTP